MGANVRDVMTTRPRAVSADTPLSQVADLMATEDVGAVPIVDGDRLIGMVTDRDIVVRVVAKGKDPRGMRAAEASSQELVTVGPDQDLDEALRLMAKNQVRRLPVVEEDGKLVGIVAQADVARHTTDEKTGEVVEQISK
jgi:CBS domain-containing protein